MREDDAAADHRGTRAAEPGRRADGRPRRLGASAQAAQLRHRVPVLRAVPESLGGAQHRVWHRGAQDVEGGRRPPRRRAARADGTAAPQAQVPRPAVGRRAAAGGAGARPGSVTVALTPRRAAVRARCPSPPVAQTRDSRSPAAPRRDDHHGDARPGGSAGDGGPHRRDEPRRGGAGRHAGRGLHAAPVTLRRAIRRADELHRRHGVYAARAGEDRRHGDHLSRARAARARNVGDDRGAAGGDHRRLRRSGRREPFQDAGGERAVPGPLHTTPAEPDGGARNNARVRRGRRRVRRARGRRGRRPHARSQARGAPRVPRSRLVIRLRHPAVAASGADVIPDRTVGHQMGREDLARYGLVTIVGFVLCLFILYPMAQLAWRSLLANDGSFVGLANYAKYFRTPSIASSITNSLYVSAVSMVITVTLAFVYAYGLTRTLMPWRGLFRVIAMLPLFAPSLVQALAFIYVFGNNGIFTRLTDVNVHIHGAKGIVLAEIFYCFPHALLILVAALSATDARLYDAARTLGASPIKTFLTVTLPGVKFGLVSACFVVFTLVITDFGAPKAIGGKFSVMATEIYNQVSGQQNFTMGATVSVVLLIPAVLAFFVDRVIQRRQYALVTSSSKPLAPRQRPLADRGVFVYCAVIAAIIAGMYLAILVYSLVMRWPYNFTPTLKHYRFDTVGGYAPIWNSVYVAACTALVGFACHLGTGHGADVRRRLRRGEMSDGRQRTALPAVGAAGVHSRHGPGPGVHLRLQRPPAASSTACTPR